MLKVILLITILNMTTAHFDNKIIPNTGIYFEQIGNINFYTEQLKIITQIDLPETQQLTDTLLDCDAHLNKLCDKILLKNPTDLCKPFQHELRWQINQISRQNIKLKEMYGRQKRGLIDIGGKFAKFVLGTMDSEDSDKIYSNLKELSDQQAKIIKIEDQHIAVLRSNFDTLSKPIIQLQNETKTIETKLNQLIDQMNSANENSEWEHKVNYQITELSTFISMQCLHIQNLQEEATEIVTAMEDKRIHPLVVPSSKIAKLIFTHIPNTNRNLTTHDVLRKITEVDHIEIEGKLIIKLTIPLLEIDEYKIYKIHLTPFSFKNKYRTYIINTEYIAWDKINGKTIEMTKDNLVKCRLIKEEKETTLQACIHNNPIIPITNAHCISNLLTQNFETTDICDTLPATTEETFIRMYSDNAWLYSLQNQTTMTVKCKNKTETLKLIGTGILTFESKCTIITKEFSIEITGKPYEIKIEQPKQEDGKQTKINIDIPETTAYKKMTKLSLENRILLNKEITSEAKKFETLRRMTEELKQHNTDSHNKTITNGSVFIITIITVVIVIMTIKARYTKTRTEKFEQKHTTKIDQQENKEGGTVLTGIRIL